MSMSVVFGYKLVQTRRRVADSRDGERDQGAASTLPVACAADCHVCGVEVAYGCSSCHRACHTNCHSELCLFSPCGFCFSHGVTTHADSPLCSGVQQANGCHACLRTGCSISSLGCPSRPTQCTALNHVCKTGGENSCDSCDRTCHLDNSSELCPLQFKRRGVLPWDTSKTSEADLQDTRMGRKDLGGRLPHRTQLKWEKVGRKKGQRVLKMDGDYYFLGFSDGSESNCFIHAIRECLNIVANVNAIRQDLMREFAGTCGKLCSTDQRSCTKTCTKVYERNYLATEHWKSVVRLLGKHCLSGPLHLDPEKDVCIRILELAWEDHGVVLGLPSAPRRLTIARENRNHFVPALRFRFQAQDMSWDAW